MPQDGSPRNAPKLVESKLNPYAPSSIESSSASEPMSSESVRCEHLPHEESIKSVGSLMIAGGVICGVLLVVTTFVAPFELAENVDGIWNQVPMRYVSMMLIYGCLGSVSIYCGRGLRNFTRGGRVIATIFCLFLQFVPVVGNFAGIYGLYLLHGKKGRFIFSDDYRRIIAETPEIRYKSSFIVNAFASLLLIVFIGQIALLLLFGR